MAQNRGGYYLKAGGSGGTMHLIIVTRDNTKKMRGKVFNFYKTIEETELAYT